MVLERLVDRPLLGVILLVAIVLIVLASATKKIATRRGAKIALWVLVPVIILYGVAHLLT